MVSIWWRNFVCHASYWILPSSFCFPVSISHRLLLWFVGYTPSCNPIKAKISRLQPKYSPSWERVQSDSVLARVEWPSLHDLSRNPKVEYWKSLEMNGFPYSLNQWREFVHQGPCAAALRYDTDYVTLNPQTIATLLFFFVCLFILCYFFPPQLVTFFFRTFFSPSLFV